MESLNRPPAQNSAKEALLAVLTTEGAVHGSGYEPLTEKERTDIEIVLSRVGMALDDSALSDLSAEILKDLLDYARMSPGSERVAKHHELVPALAAERANFLKTDTSGYQEAV